MTPCSFNAGKGQHLTIEWRISATQNALKAQSDVMLLSLYPLSQTLKEDVQLIGLSAVNNNCRCFNASTGRDTTSQNYLKHLRSFFFFHTTSHKPFSSKQDIEKRSIKNLAPQQREADEVNKLFLRRVPTRFSE